MIWKTTPFSTFRGLITLVAVVVATAMPILAAPEQADSSPANPLTNPQRFPVLEVSPAISRPRVDASPDDPAWQHAARTEKFGLSLGPSARGLTPLPTEVHALWDKDFLYLRFICHDTQIYAPIDASKRDAPFYRGDVVEVFLDAKGDGRQYFELQISPDNGIFDQLFLLTAEARFGPEMRLDDEVRARDWWPLPGWTLDGLKSATSRQLEGENVTGWIADIALPAKPLLRRLGMDHFSPMSLRANFTRYDWQMGASPAGESGAGMNAAGGEDSSLARRHLVAMNWSPISWGNPHVSAAAMGFLKLSSNKTQPK